jgi:UDP-glucose 4-epimerase
LFNTVGPRQTGRYGMVVPRFVQQALAGDSLTVYGDGGQSRCFCHVADVTRALAELMLTERSYGEVYNVGSSEEITMRDLALRVIGLTRSGSEISLIPYEEAFQDGFEDMYRRIPDTRKVRELIGWQAERSLDEIVIDVAGHHRGASEWTVPVEQLTA